MTAQQSMAETGEQAGLTVERRGAAAIVVLNRPASRNALSIGMRAVLAEALPALGRDPMIYGVVMRSAVDRVFSAGGDIREITTLAGRDLSAARQALGRELALCWLYECFSKPIVSLIDGVVMGTGVGITLFGTHRVAGSRYRFAMPETAIGYFPDCGVMHVFARMPQAIGRYLGLTGRAVGRADAYALGLVTHCIDQERYAEIEAHLAEADPIDPVLDGLHQDPGPSPVLAEVPRIGRYFEGASIAQIFRRLSQPAAGDEAWAATVLEDLKARSPMALAVTDEAIRRAASLDIRETLLQDFRLAWRFLELPDLYEGVRARLIEKDGSPRWRPKHIEDVEPAAVLSLLAPLNADELGLPTRAEMQSARV